MADITKFSCDRCGAIVDSSWLTYRACGIDGIESPKYHIEQYHKSNCRLCSGTYTDVHLCPECSEKLEKWLKTPEKKHTYTVEIWFNPKRGRCDRAKYYSIPADNYEQAEDYVRKMVAENRAYKRRTIRTMIVIENDETNEKINN